MKQWTFPQVSIEGFAANEYVAACQVVGTDLIITCAFNGTDAHGNGGSHTHQPAGSSCTSQLTIPLDQWGQFNSNGTFYDENGQKLSNSASPSVVTTPYGYYVTREKVSKYWADKGYGPYVYIWSRYQARGGMYYNDTNSSHHYTYGKGSGNVS